MARVLVPGEISAKDACWGPGPFDPKKKARGIMRPSIEGCPDATEMSAVRMQSAVKHNSIYKSDEAIRDGQGEEAWRAAKAAVAVSSKPKDPKAGADGSAGSGALSVTFGSSGGGSSKKRSAGDVAGLLDDVFGGDVPVIRLEM